MLYVCKHNDNEYLVKKVGNDVNGEVEVQFVGRTTAGKGRLPNNKIVPCEELKLLVDHAVAKELPRDVS